MRGKYEPAKPQDMALHPRTEVRVGFWAVQSKMGNEGFMLLLSLDECNRVLDPKNESDVALRYATYCVMGKLVESKN